MSGGKETPGDKGVQEVVGSGGLGIGGVWTVYQEAELEEREGEADGEETETDDYVGG